MKQVLDTPPHGEESMMVAGDGMDRFMQSPDAGKAKKSSSMQRKLADILSPLLVGSRNKQPPPAAITTGSNAQQAQHASASSASRPATPTGSAPQTPTQGARASPRSPMAVSPRLNANTAAPAESLARMDVSDGNRSKKSSADSNMSVASTAPTNHVAPTAAAAAAAAALQASAAALSPHPRHHSPSASAHASHHHPHGVPTSSSPPALLTPQLERLLRAARHCALPPSPRAEPPPGSPAGTPNQTTLLALSHTLPPRMVRQHWCVDDYVMGEKLYTGYASTVFKAQCKRSGETVVLKIYTLAAVCDLYKYQIYREVRVHASLQHENVVTLHAAFQEGDRIIMVQEYADGSDLFTLLHKYGGRLSERLAVQMVLDPFLRVLHYLHTRAIIHRDIKPENILFTKNMVLKLGDFGLAIDLREERAVTRAGTLDYMAPEVLRCPFKSRPEENKDNAGLHYGARVDAWAVGVLTFELLAGFPPFFDQSRTNTEQHIVTKTPEFPPSVSDEARAFISRALHKNPADRPTIQEMLNHPWVDQYRARRSMRAVPTSSSSTSSSSSASAAAAAAALAALGAPTNNNIGAGAAGHAKAHAARAAAAAVAAQQAQQQQQQQAVSKTRLVATQTNITAGTMVQQAMVAQQQMAMAAAAKVAPAYPAPLTHIMNSINEDSSSSPAPPPGQMSLAQQLLGKQQPQQAQQQASRLPSGDASVFMNVGSGTWAQNKAPPSAQVMARLGLTPDSKYAAAHHQLLMAQQAAGADGAHHM